MFTDNSVHRPTGDDFEAITISLYHKLNDERGEILAAIRATGAIYGCGHSQPITHVN